MSKLTANQQKWVDALRSGEFKQCTGTLNEGDFYCCLGVACVVAGADGVPVSRNRNGDIGGGTLGSQQHVATWLGFQSFTGAFGKGESLSQLNDQGKTFPEIADIIEAHADELFVAPSTEGGE